MSIVRQCIRKSKTNTGLKFCRKNVVAQFDKKLCDFFFTNYTPKTCRKGR